MWELLLHLSYLCYLTVHHSLLQVKILTCYETLKLFVWRFKWNQPYDAGFIFTLYLEADIKKLEIVENNSLLLNFLRRRTSWKYFEVWVAHPCAFSSRSLTAFMLLDRKFGSYSFTAQSCNILGLHKHLIWKEHQITFLNIYGERGKTSTLIQIP